MTWPLRRLAGSPTLTNSTDPGACEDTRVTLPLLRSARSQAIIREHRSEMPLTYSTASASPWELENALAEKPQRPNFAAKRRMVSARVTSAPQTASLTDERSNCWISCSGMRLQANSYPKDGLQIPVALNSVAARSHIPGSLRKEKAEKQIMRLP
eukprot:1129606-Rhodomonas_salina.7